MKIKEIINLEPRDEPPNKYLQFFRNITATKPMLTNKTLKISKDENEINLGVFTNDTNKIVSYVSFQKDGEFWQLTMQATDHDYRNQGFIRYCIEYAIKKYGPVISDDRQTPDAKSVWTALIKTPNMIDYYYYNKKTKKKYLIKWNQEKQKLNFNPWRTDNPDIAMLAIAKHVNEESEKLYEEKCRWRETRGYIDYWIGEGFTRFHP